MLNFTLCAATVVALASVAQADTVGFRTAGVGGAEPRPLNVAFWYPTEETGPEIEFGATPAFVGFTAIDDAEPSAGEHPLVVLSHGYGGTWRSLAWLGVALAERGYVVAAPDHPGTTYFNRDRRQAGMLWERPHDLSRVIDAVLRDPALAGEIDPDRIAAVGHSIGGWTVSALAGARFDPDRFARDCTTEIVSRACPDNPGYDMPDLRMNAEPLRQDMSDPRVRAFVSLDLGLARFHARKPVRYDSPGSVGGSRDQYRRSAGRAGNRLAGAEHAGRHDRRDDRIGCDAFQLHAALPSGRGSDDRKGRTGRRDRLPRRWNPGASHDSRRPSRPDQRVS